MKLCRIIEHKIWTQPIHFILNRMVWDDRFRITITFIHYWSWFEFRMSVKTIMNPFVGEKETNSRQKAFSMDKMWIRIEMKWPLIQKEKEKPLIRITKNTLFFSFCFTFESKMPQWKCTRNSISHRYSIVHSFWKLPFCFIIIKSKTDYSNWVNK